MRRSLYVCYMKNHIHFLSLEKMNRFPFADCLWANIKKVYLGLEKKKLTCLFVNGNFNFTYYCCVYVYDDGYVHTMERKQKSEDNVVELVLSFHLCTGSMESHAAKTFAHQAKEPVLSCYLEEPRGETGVLRSMCKPLPTVPSYQPQREIFTKVFVSV